MPDDENARPRSSGTRLSRAVPATMQSMLVDSRMVSGIRERAICELYRINRLGTGNLHTWLHGFLST